MTLISKEIDSINTKDDLAGFVSGLREELTESPEEWENQTLDRFLDAMESWIRVIDAYSKNTGDVEALSPSWKTFAKILYAAKVYE
ncbi:MAG TPA: hypothetical protein VGE28_10910 [Pseudomonas sp.]